MPRWVYSDRRSFPRKGGVYALYDAHDALLYIGASSGNIRDRVLTHLRKPWGVVNVKVSVSNRGVYQREQRLIRRLTPPSNQRVTQHTFRAAL